MPRARSGAEHQTYMRAARLAQTAGRVATKQRNLAEAAAAEAQARALLAEEIASAAPLLTAEQREALRPILAGTIPAEPIKSAA